MALHSHVKVENFEANILLTNKQRNKYFFVIMIIILIMMIVNETLYLKASYNNKQCVEA